MIEAGEYVKTKDGIIDKVIIEYNGKCNNPNCDRKHISCRNNYYNEDNIVKHSKNIIDLIEVGDFVNGYIVTTWSDYDEDGNDVEGLGITYDYEENTVLPLDTIEIKTILTKEQYEQNCFRVIPE